MDTVPASVRSEIMRRVHSEHTRPEMAVRRLVFSMGFRYRLHGKNLPGKPDLVFSARREAIFVHGCFWHGHRCEGGELPTSNNHCRGAKLGRNAVRGQRTARCLKARGPVRRAVSIRATDRHPARA
jgi:DNA mismatch endonuclease (patch repair protein)